MPKMLIGNKECHNIFKFEWPGRRRFKFHGVKMNF